MKEEDGTDTDRLVIIMEIVRLARSGRITTAAQLRREARLHMPDVEEAVLRDCIQEAAYRMLKAWS